MQCLMAWQSLSHVPAREVAPTLGVGLAEEVGCLNVRLLHRDLDAGRRGGRGWGPAESGERGRLQAVAFFLASSF
jgi:hypothetical protein